MGKEFGNTGINQVTLVLGVVEEPTANTVGLLQVKVCVNILALTFGGAVLEVITTGTGL